MKLEEIKRLIETQGICFCPDYTCVITREVVKLLAIAKAASILVESARYDVIDRDVSHLPGWEQTAQALKELEKE